MRVTPHLLRCFYFKHRWIYPCGYTHAKPLMKKLNLLNVYQINIVQTFKFHAENKTPISSKHLLNDNKTQILYNCSWNTVKNKISYKINAPHTLVVILILTNLYIL